MKNYIVVFHHISGSFTISQIKTTSITFFSCTKTGYVLLFYHNHGIITVIIYDYDIVGCPIFTSRFNLILYLIM